MDHLPPAAEGWASSSAAPGELNVNLSPPLHPLEYLVLNLPIEHITPFLSNVSVGFLALAINRCYRSPSSNLAIGAHHDAVVKLMEIGGVNDGPGRWANIELVWWDRINDVDVGELLSMVNSFWGNEFKFLTISMCHGVDGSGLLPLIHSNALTGLVFCGNKKLALRNSPRFTDDPPLKVVRDTFSRIIGGENLLEYVHLPSDWLVNGRNLGIARCCNSCCQRGPTEKMYWCHGCRSGPYCNKSFGTLFVLCHDMRPPRGYCLNCIQYGGYGQVARQCAHDGCNRWYCTCLCDSPECFGCDRQVCLHCGTLDTVDQTYRFDSCIYGCCYGDEFCVINHRGRRCN